MDFFHQVRRVQHIGFTRAWRGTPDIDPSNSAFTGHDHRTACWAPGFCGMTHLNTWHIGDGPLGQLDQWMCVRWQAMWRN